MPHPPHHLAWLHTRRPRCWSAVTNFLLGSFTPTEKQTESLALQWFAAYSDLSAAAKTSTSSSFAGR